MIEERQEYLNPKTPTQLPTRHGKREPMKTQQTYKQIAEPSRGKMRARQA